MGSVFDDSRIFAHTKVAALNGSPQSGKTWWGWGVCDAAGVDPKLALVETSTPIIALAEHFRLFLLNMQGWGLLTDESTAVPIVLQNTYSWLGSVGDGLLPEVPREVFTSSQTPSRLLPGRAERIMKSIAEVWSDPGKYSEPVSLDNKSGDYRHLLTAINLPTSELACLWLNAYRRELGGITNLWPYWAMKTHERTLTANPDLPVVIIAGFRMPGDDKVLPSHAYYLRRTRPGAQLHQDHVRYDSESYIPPVDYEIVGDCLREEPDHNDRLLASRHFWWLMNEPGLLPAGQRGNIVLNTEDLVRAELVRTGFTRR
jgi:hypothetical protein